MNNPAQSQDNAFLQASSPDSTFFQASSEDSVFLQASSPASRFLQTPSEDSGSLLQAHDLVVAEGFTEVPLLYCQTLTVTAGTLLGIQGASGSGKTSLIQTLSGYKQPISGSIILGNQPFSTLKRKKKEAIRSQYFGMVLQNAGLVSVLTALENIKTGATIAGKTVNKPWVTSLVASLDLEAVINHIPAELSGGQQIRVQIIRALLTQAPILMLDEPTSGLDESAAKKVIALLKSYVKENERAIIVSSHDPNMLQACDRLYGITESKRLVQQQ